MPTFVFSPPRSGKNEGMRILQLCPRVPFPPNDGGTIAMCALSDGLLKCGNEVSVMALNTKKHYVGDEKFSASVPPDIDFQAVFHDTSVSVSGILDNLFSGRSYHVTRFYSPSFEKNLILKLTKNYDVVQLEGLSMAVYTETIRKYSSAKIVLRAHNVEHIIWERITKGLHPGIKKEYFRMQTKRLKEYEKKSLNQFDALVAITAHDATVFRNLGCSVPVHVAPVGLNIDEYRVSEQVPDPEILFHFGSMEWMPNEEGVRWFLEQAWQKISEEFPGIKFYIAGRNMPGWIRKLNMKNVHVEENIEDPKKYISSRSVMIVPLLSGSGMRVKIIEGLALGKAIVSTTVGAEGIDVRNKKNILIADTPDEFYRAISEIVRNKELYLSLCREARVLAKEKYDSAVISEKLMKFYSELFNSL